MTCAELVELVTAYLDGTLSDAERAEFDEHLALCPGVRPLPRTVPLDHRPARRAA